MSIGWLASMETGAPVLDAQRRVLVERADALVAAIETGGDRSSVERALREFGDYSVRHFSQVAGFREAYERGGASPRLAEDLSCELSGWVGRYIPGPVTELPCVVSPR
jgi:hypothetical protein